VSHGIVDVFAYQEALLIEAVFGIGLLTMIWVGFRRWLQHKDRMGRLIAEQTAERAAQYGAHMEAVEARLKTVEQIVTETRPPVAQIGTPAASPLPDAILKRGEITPIHDVSDRSKADDHR
jgi:hypothetical protein